MLMPIFTLYLYMHFQYIILAIDIGWKQRGKTPTLVWGRAKPYNLPKQAILPEIRLRP